MFEGELAEQRVMIWQKDDFEELFESGYGKEVEGKVELTLIESMYLLKRGKLKIRAESKKKFFSEEDFFNYCKKTERNFHAKLVVYTDLREKGFLVKTGFKFGCDFRVYERGVKLKKGPKQAHEHTKWVVHAIPEEFSCSFPELSRAVRLAQNIRTEMIWAIVDSESDVTYYKITRISP
ncbi:tRNA-intron lyase [Candidatus Micrarchaeota archaeon RBG_16_49_10]|nr:MAG: tRNA-intron lyase [Candidatus Micrarchaeota archaeon RBG_16_49_10]